MASSSNNNKKKTVFLLTGDIGGTNSRMSLYRVLDDTSTSTTTELIGTHTFRNATQYQPESVLQEESAFCNCIVTPFFQQCWRDYQLPPASPETTVIVACIASAGFVSSNQEVRLTNLGNLLISGPYLQDNTSTVHLQCLVQCWVINDFVAQGYGCLTLQPSEVHHLNGPTLDQFETGSGPKVCVGAGTGLGQCYLTPHPSASSNGSSSSYACFPSEGGHVEYAPRNALEWDMVQHLANQFDNTKPHVRISVERVVSGTGLANVYHFLAVHHKPFHKQRNETVYQEFLHAGDEQGRVVAQHTQDCPVCAYAMDVFLQAYGQEVGSAALKWIPTSGLFVTGGLTPKNLHHLTKANSLFLQSYRYKGRVQPLLDRIPLYAVLVQDLGIRGAHHAALQAYRDYLQQQEQQEPAQAKATTNSLTSTWTVVAAAVAAVAMVAVLKMTPRSSS